MVFVCNRCTCHTTIQIQGHMQHTLHVSVDVQCNIDLMPVQRFREFNRQTLSSWNVAPCPGPGPSPKLQGQHRSIKQILGRAPAASESYISTELRHETIECFLGDPEVGSPGQNVLLMLIVQCLQISMLLVMSQIFHPGFSHFLLPA